jgi:2-polyprenyl-6-methoxyphenol hydroxylase-like FAD-dependent oxidoreductase
VTDASRTAAEVLIVGAGPAGLLLAGELRLAGVDTVVIERHPRRPDYCRGFNLNARALDLLARRGIADQLIAEGWQVPHAHCGDQVGIVHASCPGKPELRAVLVRPDGHIAWLRTSDDDHAHDVRQALRRWFR